LRVVLKTETQLLNHIRNKELLVWFKHGPGARIFTMIAEIF